MLKMFAVHLPRNNHSVNTRDNKERKFRRVTKLIQELGLHDDEEKDADSSDYSDIDEDDKPQTIPNDDDENPDKVPQDF